MNITELKSLTPKSLANGLLTDLVKIHGLEEQEIRIDKLLPDDLPVVKEFALKYQALLIVSMMPKICDKHLTEQIKKWEVNYDEG